MKHKTPEPENTNEPTIEALCNIAATLAAGKNTSAADRRTLAKVALDLWAACSDELEERRELVVRDRLKDLDNWIKQQQDPIPFVTGLARLLPTRNSNDRQKVFRDYCKHKRTEKRGQQAFNLTKSNGFPKSNFVRLVWKFEDWYAPRVEQSKAQRSLKGLEKARAGRTAS